MRRGMIWMGVNALSITFVSTKQLPHTRVVNRANRCPVSFCLPVKSVCDIFSHSLFGRIAARLQAAIL